MKRVDLYMTEQQIKALNQISEQTGLSFSELVRRAIDLFTERKKNEPKH